MRKTSVYKVTVKTMNSGGKTFEIDGEYYDCESGEIFVLTDNPEDIYRAIGKDTIISVEKIGVGYSLSNVGSEK